MEGRESEGQHTTTAVEGKGGMTRDPSGRSEGEAGIIHLLPGVRMSSAARDPSGRGKGEACSTHPGGRGEGERGCAQPAQRCNTID